MLEQSTKISTTKLWGRPWCFLVVIVAPDFTRNGWENKHQIWGGWYWALPHKWLVTWISHPFPPISNHGNENSELILFFGVSPSHSCKIVDDYWKITKDSNMIIGKSPKIHVNIQVTYDYWKIMLMWLICLILWFFWCTSQLSAIFDDHLPLR